METWTLVEALDKKWGDVSEKLETPPSLEAHNPIWSLVRLPHVDHGRRRRKPASRDLDALVGLRYSIQPRFTHP